MHRWFRVLVLWSLVLTVGIHPHHVSAQEITPLNLTITPINLVLESTPGQTQTASLKLRNNAPSPEQLKIRLGSFKADASGGNPELLEIDPQTEFLQWLKVSETEFSLDSNEWKTINLTFSPPETAALSYYYALYIERAINPTLSPGETQVTGSAAVLILTTVTSPNARQELQLESVKVTRSWVEFLPQEIHLTIRNTGNVHLAPVGNIFIDGQGQKDLAVLSINPYQNMILPNSSRTFTVPWADGFPNWNQDSGRWQWDFSQADKFRLGRYTAHIVMVYDNGQRDVPIESFIDFWVIPWRMGLVVLAVPLLPAVLVFLIMRWRYHHD